VEKSVIEMFLIGVSVRRIEDVTEALPELPAPSEGRGLCGVRLFITDACMGLLESLADLYPKSTWQRCIVLDTRAF